MKKAITQQQPIFEDSLFFKEKAKICATTQSKYRKLVKAASREERYMSAFLKQCKLMEIPNNKLKAFEVLYKDAFARISMIRKAVKKEFKGKVSYAGQTNTFVGPALVRLVQYISEEFPVAPTEDFKLLIKELKGKVTMQIDQSFASESFKFLEYVQEDVLVLRDIQTFNVVNIKALAKALPEDQYKNFYKTLCVQPWMRCSSNSMKFLYKYFSTKLIEMWEERLCIKLPKILHLGKVKKEIYYRFMLACDTDGKWHTAETEAIARLVAKEFKSEITKLEEINPNQHKSIDIRNLDGVVIKAVVKWDGDWQDEPDTELE